MIPNMNFCAAYTAISSDDPFGYEIHWNYSRSNNATWKQMYLQVLLSRNTETFFALH
jgi:hypothetical protein